MQKPHVVIIGAGVAGLFSGALLAKEGFHVTLIEKNISIGGGLQTFSRFGETFDAGMHLICGMNKGGRLRAITDHLGISHLLHLAKLDNECCTKVYTADNGKNYSIASKAEGFIKSLSNLFPSQSDNIRRYVAAIHQLQAEMENEQYALIPNHSEEYNMAADAFIRHYISDSRLASIISHISLFYGGKASVTPASTHAIISSLYLEDSTRFVGRASQLADLLKDIIINAGGNIAIGDAVNKIEIKDRHIVAIHTHNGLSISGDEYIAAIHPQHLLSLLPQDTLPRLYQKRIAERENTYSAFCIYLKLRHNTFPYLNHIQYYIASSDNLWHACRTDNQWPHIMLFTTPPCNQQGLYARKAEIIVPMNFETVRQWAGSSRKNRPEEYTQWKRQIAERILSNIELIYPGLRSAIDEINTASPLSIRDYYNSADGSIYGLAKSCESPLTNNLPLVTKIDNLIIASQSNVLNGLCGTAATAQLAADTIIKRHNN